MIRKDKASFCIDWNNYVNEFTAVKTEKDKFWGFGELNTNDVWQKIKRAALEHSVKSML